MVAYNRVAPLFHAVRPLLFSRIRGSHDEKSVSAVVLFVLDLVVISSESDRAEPVSVDGSETGVWTQLDQVEAFT